MATLLASFAVFCLCVASTPAKPAEPNRFILFFVIASAAVFVARILGFVISEWGW